MSHLLEAGHRRIAFVGGPLSIRQVSRPPRRRGPGPGTGGPQRQRPAHRGGDARAERDRRPAGRRDHRRAARAGGRPTGIFCANDLLALGVLQEMTLHRIAVPEDIAIVGYDDVDFAAAAAVPLSSVRQPRHQLGRAAAQLLIEEALGDGTHRHRQVVFEPDLVIRRFQCQRGPAGPAGAAPQARQTPAAENTGGEPRTRPAAG